MATKSCRFWAVRLAEDPVQVEAAIPWLRNIRKTMENLNYWEVKTVKTCFFFSLKHILKHIETNPHAETNPAIPILELISIT